MTSPATPLSGRGKELYGHDAQAFEVYRPGPALRDFLGICLLPPST